MLASTELALKCKHVWPLLEQMSKLRDLLSKVATNEREQLQGANIDPLCSDESHVGHIWPLKPFVGG